MIDRVIAIDPGRLKCGIAVVSRAEGVLAKTTVALPDLQTTAKLLAARFKPEVLLIGGGTGARVVAESVSGLQLAIHIVDERLSTHKARARYFADHPPRGWRRLVPRGLLVPPEPYDDYAAVLIAEGFLGDQARQT